MKSAGAIPRREGAGSSPGVDDGRPLGSPAGATPTNFYLLMTLVAGALTALALVLGLIPMGA